MTGRGARQARVSLCDVVSSVRRASVPGYLHHREEKRKVRMRYYVRLMHTDTVM